MNIKRYLVATLALIIFMGAYECYVHTVLLSHIYSETPQLWRTMGEMSSHGAFGIATMVALALWITFIFARLFPEGGVKNGLHLGVYLGVLSAIQAAGAYYYMPISINLAVYWFIVYVIESVVGGLLIGAIYKR